MENDMHPSPATRLTAYATKFPRMTAVELAKLTGEPPKTVRAVLAHLGRQ